MTIFRTHFGQVYLIPVIFAAFTGVLWWFEGLPPVFIFLKMLLVPIFLLALFALPKLFDTPPGLGGRPHPNPEFHVVQSIVLAAWVVIAVADTHTDLWQAIVDFGSFFLLWFIYGLTRLRWAYRRPNAKYRDTRDR